MMTEEEVAEARKSNPYFRSIVGEAQRQKLYPHTFPSERPVVDMTQPCWWCPDEIERQLTIAFRDATWLHWVRLWDRSNISREIFWKGPSVERDAALAAAERSLRIAREVKQWCRIILWDYISQHGSIIDNGSVRTVHPPKEGRDVFAYYEI